jgi:hypothetical protein
MRKIRWIGWSPLVLISLAGSILLANPQPAHGDRTGYQKIVHIFDRGSRYLVLHEHDWSARTQKARWEVKNPLSGDNTYSYLEVIDEASHTQVFRAPVPALTEVWLSPDQRFVVGLSRIKLDNPVQLVIFSTTGTLLLSRAVDCHAAKVSDSCMESVTNYIDWYNPDRPDPSVRQLDSHTFELSVNDPSLKRIAITFQVPQDTF